MTHISGTPQLKSKTHAVRKKSVERAKIKEKLAIKTKIQFLEQKYWILIGLTLSLISVILGFVIYKSFFILAVFLPISLLAIRYVINFFEESISKFDTLSK